MSSMGEEWNHNIQYHGLVLSLVPQPCRRGLDIGCGSGLLARQLASHCEAVVGIDSDASVLPAARADKQGSPNLEYVAGDVMTYPFPQAYFDLVAVVATLHHLSLEAALVRFRHLLAPGGVLIVVGLYRPKTIGDFFFAIAGSIASRIVRCFRRLVEVQALTTSPKETLQEIREAAAACLPEAVVRRRLFFRYTLVWRKPDDGPNPVE